MRTQKGFTLLEVLIVVVIAVSVAAFAVPAYKKSQDRNRYMAAQGVLIDLGNGLRSLQADLAVTGVTYPTSPVYVQTSWQTSSLANDADITASNANVALFARKYMSPIPFDSSNTYKGYLFSVCPLNKATSSNCCNNDKEVVACMRKSSAASGDQYYRALFYQDGSVKRLPKS